MSERKEQDPKPYEKPAVKVIELVADEVLAVSCKTSSQGSGPTIGSCIAPSCFSLGS